MRGKYLPWIGKSEIKRYAGVIGGNRGIGSLDCRARFHEQARSITCSIHQRNTTGSDLHGRGISDRAWSARIPERSDLRAAVVIEVQINVLPADGANHRGGGEARVVDGGNRARNARGSAAGIRTLRNRAGYGNRNGT